MRPTWKTRAELTTSSKLIESVERHSIRDFSLPPTLESDFKRFLQHDHPNNFTFELIPDWYSKSGRKYIRAAQTAIDWKSKIGNSDMSTNFKVAKDESIRKGDMVTREDGVVYILNWNVQNHPENWATQSTECNASIEFTRNIPDKTDARGMQVVPAHTEIIAPAIPCIHAEYAGRPDFAAAQGMPGVHGDHLITINLQWNDKTKEIRIDDEFVLGTYTYRVVNVSIAEVQIDQKYGVLTLNARRVAGGGGIE